MSYLAILEKGIKENCLFALIRSSGGLYVLEATNVAIARTISSSFRAVRRLDLNFGRAFIDAEHLIAISELNCHLSIKERASNWLRHSVDPKHSSMSNEQRRFSLRDVNARRSEHFIAPLVTALEFFGDRPRVHSIARHLADGIVQTRIESVAHAVKPGHPITLKHGRRLR